MRKRDTVLLEMSDGLDEGEKALLRHALEQALRIIRLERAVAHDKLKQKEEE